MKKILSLCFIALFLGACTKDDDTTPTPNPVDLLPPATQTGAMTFGCLINGEPYIAKNDKVVAYYQYWQGQYYFIVKGLRKKESNPKVWKVSLTNNNNAPIESNKTYVLNGDVPGYKGWLNIIGGPNNNIQFTHTNNMYTGELTITHFSFDDEIVSGTFWFDVEDPWTGEKIEIREGRFDAYFLQ